MMRRILCLPSDHHTSSSSAEDDDSIVTMMEEEEKQVDAFPGLVARLMGLDSMPDKITRSRDLHIIKHKESKSSGEWSYIDIEEDDKFIVLSFPQNDMRSNRDKTIEEVKKQENSRRKKQIRLVKKNSDSDESSPISVFDFQQQGSTSDDNDSWTRSSNSTRVSPEQDNISIDQQKPAAAAAALLKKKKKKTKAAVVVNGQKKNREMWGNITVADIKADLAAEFEVHIMDQLFNELLNF